MAIRPHLVTFSVPVDDLSAAADFYRQLLGKEPVEPTPGKLEFELVNGAWLQLNGDPAEDGKPARVLLSVDDIESAVADAKESGAEVGDIESFADLLAWAEGTGPGGQRFSLIAVKR
ncbi:MAG: VOC family protein [Actinomycetaceae bacterium]|nr:VOC family protein [Actinomycetaceae bacterium]